MLAPTTACAPLSPCATSTFPLFDKTARQPSHWKRPFLETWPLICWHRSCCRMPSSTTPSLPRRFALLCHDPGLRAEPGVRFFPFPAPDILPRPRARGDVVRPGVQGVYNQRRGGEVGQPPRSATPLCCTKGCTLSIAAKGMFRNAGLAYLANRCEQNVS